MAQPEHADVVHKAVLWMFLRTEDGEDIVDEPEELDVRWVNGRSESKDSQGNRVMLDARASVDRRIEPSSIMWRGELGDVVGTSFEGQLSELMQVVSYNEADDVRARETRRTVGLVKFRGVLPQVES